MENRSAPPVLSICIPTYNRSALLSRHLTELDQPGLFPFPFEVVVADNCSTDDTQAMLQSMTPTAYRLRAIRNPRNTGVILNHINNLRRATGEFCVYVADDDRLNIPKLVRAVEQMIETPDSVALYTGWIHRDLTTGAFKEVVAQLPDGVYPREHGGDLVEAILKAYLFPEVALYRVSALVRVLFPSPTLFWPFPLIDRLLQIGSVLTTSESFYQVVDRHPGETEARGSAGQGLEQRVWAGIADGINLLTTKYRSEQTSAPASDPKGAYFAYIGNQSFFSSVHRRRYAEAFETAMQLNAKGTLLRHHDDADWNNFLTHVALENTQRAFEIMGGLEKLVCVGFDPAIYAELVTVFAQTSGTDSLPVSSSGLLSLPPDLDRCGVLTASNSQRDVLLARGQPIGQVFSLEDLRTVFSLAGATRA